MMSDEFHKEILGVPPWLLDSNSFLRQCEEYFTMVICFLYASFPSKFTKTYSIDKIFKLLSFVNCSYFKNHPFYI